MCPAKLDIYMQKILCWFNNSKLEAGKLTEKNNTSNRLVKIILVLLGIALVLWLCWISLPVLIPFLVGMLLAYLLIPLVKWLEKVLPPKGKEKKFKRAVAVIIVFVLFTVFLIAFIIYIGSAMVTA